MRPLLMLLLGLTLASGAAAEEDCSYLATQLDMNQCAGRNFDAADAELNRVYRQVVDRLASDPEGLAKLKAAERAWVAFRDAECTFAAMSVEAGSIHPMIWLGCREEQTQARTRVLQGYLACEDGDLACPL